VGREYEAVSAQGAWTWGRSGCVGGGGRRRGGGDGGERRRAAAAADAFGQPKWPDSALPLTSTHPFSSVTFSCPSNQTKAHQSTQSTRARPHQKSPLLPGGTGRPSPTPFAPPILESRAPRATGRSRGGGPHLNMASLKRPDLRAGAKVRPFARARRVGRRRLWRLPTLPSFPPLARLPRPLAPRPFLPPSLYNYWSPRSARLDRFRALGGGL
jgi:hypothetical protein